MPIAHSINKPYRAIFALALCYLLASHTSAVNYVGSESCASCHQEQYQLWQQSHHHAAMQKVTEKTVLGDFNNNTFTYGSVTTRFYRQGEQFMVATDNARGEIENFSISYTFGVAPLQQYLIAFPDGRYQALNVAWDSRPKNAGGQRWFHLYPDEVIDYKDALHWTGAFHNWNSRCASCHSTNLKKNYTQSSDSYATTWSELNVACEACHGPASAHVQWSKNPSTAVAHKGFDYALADAGQWQAVAGKNTAQRSDNARPMHQLNTCAHCHSRRVELNEPPLSPEFFEAHQSEFLARDLYHPDGQIRDEDYEYDAFLQSKMHRAGVVCSNCHEPHSGALRAPGNGVCLQCHQAKVFDTAKHHHHSDDSSGAQCANCHMPETTYMVVDPRRDHSLRIPRPDLSVSLGTPNACNQCHQDKTAAWAAAITRQWYGEKQWPQPELGRVLSSAWQVHPTAAPELIQLANDASRNSIVRASALQELAAFPQQASFEAARTALSSEDPALRTGALRALDFLPPEQRQMLFPLLNDPSKAVRMELAPMLNIIPAQNIPQQIAPLLSSVFDEYIAAQKLNADMPSAQLNLGIFYANIGDQAAAETAYLHAQKLAPQFVPTLLNLADFYRAQNRDEQAKPLLTRAIEIAPDQAAAYHALGLLLIRQQQLSAAIANLRRAAELQPEVVRYAYVYAIAVESTGKITEALRILEKALERHTQDYELLSALVQYYEKTGQQTNADKHRQTLTRLYPPTTP